MPNQNPEQIARDSIDKQLTASGWIVQGIKKINLHAGAGVAVREYLTDVGPADYVLFVEGKLSFCDKIEETISQSLQQAETLKQRILKKAFEGRMVN
jgi:type I site-specific restriction endonuclease